MNQLKRQTNNKVVELNGQEKKKHTEDSNGKR